MRILRLLLATVLLASGLAPLPARPPDAPAAPKVIQAKLAQERCAAKTRKGPQCKRKASAGSKFCWQHGGKKKQAP